MTTNILANFNFPCEYRLGAGRIGELPSVAKDRGIMRPLVVTDPGVLKLPWFEPIIAALTVAGHRPTVYSEVHPNPIEQDVTRGVSAYRQGDCDGVIMVGGGSAMDAAKCIALMVENPGQLFDYEDVGDNYKRADGTKIPPMIAVPSTAGTGSEVGRASLIINHRREKKIIFHPRMQPPVVIADPELTVGLPPSLTAYTGMDAFTHCFEAWCATGYHPMADGIALEGMRLIASHLPRAFKNGSDLEARTHMIMASSMGAVAFQKGLGVVHAISHTLGGKLDVQHGLANSILLPYCMVFNRPAIDERCCVLARHLGLASPSFDGLLEWVLTRREELSIPHSLALVPGMTEETALELAGLALSDPALGGNPRPALEDDLAQILVRALQGRLE